MLTVHKQVLEREPHQEIKLPLNATILKLEIQQNKPVLYYHCDNKEERFQVREVLTAVTGGQAGSLASYDYLGTAMLDEDSFVLHFFMAK